MQIKPFRVGYPVNLDKKQLDGTGILNGASHTYSVMKRLLGRILGTVGAMALGVGAYAQSFNVDFDSGGGVALGSGVPSNSYGAAAGQAGFWNAIPGSSIGDFHLRGLDGVLSSVVVSGPSGGVGNAFNQPLNTGDYALLINDSRNISDDFWSFSGLANGRYRLFTYACSPAGSAYTTRVTVTNGVLSESKLVQSPCAFNSFVLGRSHSIHEFDVVNGQFNFRAEALGPSVNINGFQLVAVPEPATLAIWGIGVPLLTFWRKRRLDG